MKKLLSTKYSAVAFNTATLALRLVFGILIMHHGYAKLLNFTGTAQHMPSFLGLSPTINAALVIFAEFFCGLFIVIGLFTRLAAIPLIITMCIIVFKVSGSDIFANGEKGMLYLCAFVVLFLIGPGRVSVDSMIGK